MDLVFPEQIRHHLVPPARADRRHEAIVVKRLHGTDFGGEQAQPEQARELDFVFDERSLAPARVKHLIHAAPLDDDRLVGDAPVTVFGDEPAALRRA